MGCREGDQQAGGKTIEKGGKSEGSAQMILYPIRGEWGNKTSWASLRSEGYEKEMLRELPLNSGKGRREM